MKQVYVFALALLVMFAAGCAPDPVTDAAYPPEVTSPEEALSSGDGVATKAAEETALEQSGVDQMEGGGGAPEETEGESPSETTAPEPQPEPQKPLRKVYQDGTYAVEVKGFKPGMQVEVTFYGDQVTGIEVIKHKDTPKYFKRAMPEMADRIVEEQTWKVDAVSNASWSSEGIKRAVRAAMEEAGVEKKEK